MLHSQFSISSELKVSLRCSREPSAKDYKIIDEICIISTNSAKYVLE